MFHFKSKCCFSVFGAFIIALNVSRAQEFENQSHIDSSHYFNLKSKETLNKSDLKLAWFYGLKAYKDALIHDNFIELGKSKINQGNVLLRNGKNDSALVYFNSALEIFQEQDLLKETGTAYNSLAGVYVVTGEYDTAKVLITKALQIASMVQNVQGMADGYNNVGALYFHQGMYPDALSAYLSSLNFAEKINNTYDIARTQSNIGNVYFKNGDFENALVYFDKAIKLQDVLDDFFGMGRSYHNIGSVEFSKGDYQKALKTYSMAIETKRRAGDSLSLARTYLNIGSVHYMLSFDEKYNDFQRDSLLNETKINYDKAIENFEMINDKQGAAMTNTNLGTILIYSGDYDESKYYLEKGLEAATEIGSKYDIMMGYYALASLDSTFGHWKSAFAFKNQFRTYKDSIRNEANTKKMMEAELNFEFERKELILQEEQKRKDLLHSKDLRWQKTLAWILFASFSLVVLTVIFYFRWRRKLLKVTYEKQLSEQREESANAIILAQEDERNRIARDLHDSLGQLLSTARINMELLPEEVKTLLTKSKKILDDASVELRNISFNLMPSTLEKQGLQGALEELSEILKSAAKSSIKLDLSGLNELKITRHWEYNIYRIIQEAVNNALKHAEATEIDIVLSNDDRNLNIQIQDNGKGFDYNSSKQNAGNGIKNMMRRTELLNGSLKINSQLNSGTKLNFQIPLN